MNRISTLRAKLWTKIFDTSSMSTDTIEIAAEEVAELLQALSAQESEINALRAQIKLHKEAYRPRVGKPDGAREQ